MKVELDSFSGHKIYPSKGRLFVRGDSKIFRFGKPKHESLFHQRKNPRDISWTQVYRRQHRKGILEGTAKKKSRKTVKHQRGFAGLSLADLAAKRAQAPAIRQKQREEAIAKAKSEKKEKEAKKVKTAAPRTTTASKQSKQQMRGTQGGGKAGR